MWQCDNCGYTDEDGTTFEEDAGEGVGETVRYCPECGSDEVFMVDEDEDDLYGEDEAEGNTEESENGARRKPRAAVRKKNGDLLRFLLLPGRSAILFGLPNVGD